MFRVSDNCPILDTKGNEHGPHNCTVELHIDGYQKKRYAVNNATYIRVKKIFNHTGFFSFRICHIRASEKDFAKFLLSI